MFIPLNIITTYIAIYIKAKKHITLITVHALLKDGVDGDVDGHANSNENKNDDNFNDHDIDADAAADDEEAEKEVEEEWEAEYIIAMASFVK